jgi:two-component system cell cycle sensor histidine kinase/response regulator CckA
MSLLPRELQIVLDGLREGVAVIDGERLREANVAFCRLVGYTHSQLLRLPAFVELIEPHDLPAWNETLRREPGPGGARSVNLRFRSRGGEPVPVDLSIRTEDETCFVFAVAAPTTSEVEDGVDSLRRVPAPSRVEESRRRFRQLVEDLPDGLVTLTDRGEFLFVNRAFAQMLGYSARSRLVARDFLEVIVPRDRDRVRRGLKRWVDDKLQRFEASLLTAGGGEIPALISGRQLPRNDDGSGGGVLLLITDFAERQALMDRLALARQMEALSSLAGGIAHDFNNLLTGILGNASRIRMATAEGGEVDQFALAVEESAELAARLTRRLLALVRGQAPDRKLLDVGELAAQTLRLLGKVVPESVRVEVQTNDDVSAVLADESQLQQALLNLCINARDAMVEHSGGGVLTVTVRSGVLRKPLDDGSMTEEKAVELLVEDTGPGIPQNLRQRVFAPFFTTKGLGRGIGLGLSTVWQLVDAHGGTIDVTDARGGGARFTLRLPAHAGRAPKVNPPKRATTPPGVATATVLLAEDEDAIREMVAAALRRKGYRVLSAEDGSRAIELWQQEGESVDLLVLDVRMPGADGSDVLRIARVDRPGIPAVFSSGFIPEEQEERERPDRVLFLPKPYRVPDLLDAVHAGLKLGEYESSGGTTGSLDGVTPLENDTNEDAAPVQPAQAFDAQRTLVGELAPITLELHPEPEE